MPGSFVELYLKTITNSQAITIPNSAILEEQGTFFVFVQVTPELFEKREVKVGPTDGLRSEITMGISPDRACCHPGSNPGKAGASIRRIGSTCRPCSLKAETMFDNLIKFSINNKFFILLSAVILIIVGLRNAEKMDVDVFPDLTAPTVVVMTDAHGMASEEVERLVTFPIETAVNGATDVRRVRSASSQGFSFVWVEFDWGTDVFKARQIVSEKLIPVSSQMPLGVGQPILAPQSSVMGEMLSGSSRTVQA